MAHGTDPGTPPGGPTAGAPAGKVRPRSRLSGRCRAGHAVVGADELQVGTQLHARMTDADGVTHDIPFSLHAKEVDALQASPGGPERAGWHWDGTTVLPSGELAYTDSSLVRGGYPEDCPVALRQRIGKAAAAWDLQYGDRHGPRQFAREVALELRRRGYPNISDRELSDLVASVAKGRSAAIWAGGRGWKHEGGLGRLLGSGDRDAYLRLVRGGDTERELYGTALHVADRLDRSQVIGVFDEHNNLVQAWLRGSSLHDDTDMWGSSPRGTGLDRLAEARWSQLARAGVAMCFSCRCAADACRCPRGTTDVADLVARASRRDVMAEHPWGFEHSVRPTEEMRAQAGAVTDSVRTIIDGSGHADAFHQCAGDAAANIALFCAQVGLDEAETLELVAGSVGDFAELFDRTRRRATERHSEYARTLYTEFYGPEATESSTVDRLYLGRDGVYSYLADQELRDVLDAHGDPRGRQGTSRYLSVSRTASRKWKPRHDRHLSEDGTVMIDTGFSGSIPEEIAARSGRTLVDVGEPVPAAGIGVRLMSTMTSTSGRVDEKQQEARRRFGFTWQVHQVDGIAIERDAKEDRSSRYAGDRVPTGAVEQLVYRHLADEVRATARRQATEILGLAGGGTAEELDDDRFGPEGVHGSKLDDLVWGQWPKRQSGSG